MDATNADVVFRRNRVRKELVPLLQANFNPLLTDTLCRTADIVAEDHDFMRRYVEDRLPKWVLSERGGYRFAADVFSQLHVAVQRELLLNLLSKLRGDVRGITFLHVEKMRELFRLERGTQSIKLPGQWQARKTYRDCFIEPIPADELVAGDARKCEESIKLSCPGETVLFDYGIVCRCTVNSGSLPQPADLGPDRAAFDCADLQFPLMVRRRRPGDLFYPLGAPGGRKLKKVLIDLKIPFALRDVLPIICDDAGILWISGYRRSQRGRLSEATREYVLIEIVKIETIH
jgi:tRNA(Ile)-lysidine synthase